VKLFSSKRRVVITAAVILLALFLARPGVSRLKNRITVSLSRAVGRPVDIRSVHLRFLPQPGFDLQNLVIYEDAAFGSEPMLRAREVTAVVRLTSLMRGRLDIARLELTEPSLNLVRRADGRWNWHDLLERTVHAPLAPTAKAKLERRPGFPYIEASSGRINFKTGLEKKPYALLNADFAVWQESENTWGARLRAEPLRTDVSMSDTGLLLLEGKWRRAAVLRDTPLQFSAEWNHAQLGQLSKLLAGNDKGWRGDVRLDATLSGSPAAMHIALDSAIQDFHRYDISNVEGLRLAAHCDGVYSSMEAVVREIACRAPVGSGLITLRGEAGLPGVHKTDLTLSLDYVPVSSIAALARRAKKNLPVDLVANGSVQGIFSAKEDGTQPTEFQGRGEIGNFQLQSANSRVKFAAASIPFLLTSNRTDQGSSARKTVQPREAQTLPAPDGLHITYGPFPVALGRPAPAQARGWLSRSGYLMALRGDGEISHTLRIAGLLGLPATQANVEGIAQLDLQIAGSWAGNTPETLSGFASPQVTGNAQLRNVHAKVRGVNEPVEISSAQLRLLPDEARVEKISAKALDSVWTGTVWLPRGCGVPGACLARFNLNADSLALADLSEWLGPKTAERHWYQILAPAEHVPSLLDKLRASGKVSIGRIGVHGVIADRASASIDLDHGKLKVTDLRADVFGGKYDGDWHADFNGSSPVYAGSGTFTGISLAKMAGAMHDPWISGTAAGTFQLTASGADAASFWQSAEGDLQFDVRDATLPHISLASDEPPLRIVRWQGVTRLHGGKIEIDKGKLLSSTAAYDVSGTASFGRVLNLKLAPADSKSARANALVYNLTGTLAEPHVTAAPAPQTQARLKP
jgi:hypothetical protein